MYVCMLSASPIRGCHVPLQPPRNPRGKANLDGVWWSHLSVDLRVCYYVRDSSVEAVGRISRDKLDTNGIESTSPHWTVIRCELGQIRYRPSQCLHQMFFCIRMFSHALLESTVISQLNDGEIAVLSDPTRDRTSAVRQLTLQVARLQVRAATLRYECMCVCMYVCMYVIVYFMLTNR